MHVKPCAVHQCRKNEADGCGKHSPHMAEQTVATSRAVRCKLWHQCACLADELVWSMCRLSYGPAGTDV